MSQDNPQISTTQPLPGLQLVQDLNKALQTLATDFSGATDPAAMAWPYSTWADTGTGTLKRRNAANSAWMIERNLFEDLRRTASATDTTAGRVLKVGDWGIGGDLPVLTGGDLLADDDYYEYYVTSALNAPAGALTTSGYVKKETRSSSFRKVTFTPFNLSTGPWVNVCNNGVWAGWVELYHSGNLSSDMQWIGTPVGGYITPLTPPPSDDPRFRYVLCTAGLTGPGGYNEGILTGETVTGSAPLVNATATVSLAGSPFDGLSVHLINTEGRFVGAGTAESFENDAIQNITGSLAWLYNTATSTPAGSGALAVTAGSSVNGLGASSQTAYSASFDASRIARTSDHTQPRAHRLIHYRRIL